MVDPSAQKKSEHEKLYEFQRLQYDAYREFTIIAIRSSALVAGGSVVIALAFVGSLYSSGNETIAKGMFLPVLIFAVGALISGFASVFAYLTQRASRKAAGGIEATSQPPYIVITKSNAAHMRLVRWFEKFTLSCIVLPYVFVIIGLVKAWWVIS
ncbi:MAG: hypothetical protein JKY82_02040 [Rhizobiaceae bacterium]|nr:hypothetical protein [Rhizobiaceae bacterium]